MIHSIGPHLVQESNISLDDLNDYKLDFLIDTELNIAPKYMGKNVHKNLRYVCSLYAPALLLIAPNDSNIVDLGDIKHYTCKVVIAVHGDQTTERYQALVQLLSVYGEQTMKNVSIINLDQKALLQGYGSTFKIYADLALLQNPIIRALTDKVPSHLVSSRKINAGGYYITYSERPFYERYPYYNKEMIDMTQLLRYYPLLAPVHNRDLYYPTINIHYILLCHDKIPKAKVQDVLHKVLLLMQTKWDGQRLKRLDQKEKQIVSKMFKGTTIADISHMSTAITLHEGAEQVYTDIQLHDQTGDSYYRGGNHV
jgi:TRAP-type uncharacterized transport system substrate-binding protein